MIVLDRVSVAYNSGVPQMALHPTTLAFQRGQFTVILGASGAGKSTLLKVINGLQHPCSGNLLVDGKKIEDEAALRRHRRSTAMIFQQHQLIKRHTVLRNVLSGRLGYYSTLRSLWPMRVNDRNMALECLHRVGLLDQALQRVDHLSIGQQQRVGIARALQQQPCMLLADEPVSSLDPVIAEQIMQLLQKICDEKKYGVVVSLHQPELARRYAQRIVGLVQGRVVFDGHVGALTEEVEKGIYSVAENSIIRERH